MEEMTDLFARIPSFWQWFTLALVVLALLFLGACTATRDSGALGDKALDQLYEATSREQRVARFAMAGVVVVEVMRERVTTQDGDDAPAALGLSMVILSKISELSTGDPDQAAFTNADLYEAAVAMGRGVLQANENRLVGLITSGLRPSRVLGSLLRAGKGEALKADIDILWQDQSDGRRTPDELIAIFRKRIEWNADRIAAIAGVPAVNSTLLQSLD